MAENKKSFVAYSDWYGTFKALPDDVAGRLIKHVFSYVNDESPSTDDYVVLALFEQIKSTLKRDLVKWEDQRAQRVNAGKKSAESRSTKSNERSVSLNEKERNSTVSVNDSVSVKGNIDERLESFQKSLEPFIEKYGQSMIKKFYQYWKEKSKSGTKMRFESEKSWELPLRLSRWHNNNFGNNNHISKEEMIPTADGGFINKDELKRLFEQ